jgi:GcrA cell cycle regulator
MTPWTEQSTARLVELEQQKLSGARIAALLADEFGHPFTRNMVLGKLDRLAQPPGTSRNPERRIRKLPRRKLKAVGPMTFNFSRTTSANRNKPEHFRAAPPPDRSACPYACGLVDLTPTSCRWPCGSPADSNFFFCGEPAADLRSNRPYCDAHHALAFTPVRR